MSLENPFLKATPLYKEYAILELLSKDSNISQRAIAKQLDSSLSMVNQYLEDYQKRDLIKIKIITGKSFKYLLTSLGEARLNYLRLKFLESIRGTYLVAKDNVVMLLNKLVDYGLNNIVMYGAGELAELSLQVLNETSNIPLNILAIADDDITKQGTKIMGKNVVSREKIKSYEYDGILIATLEQCENMRYKLISDNYNSCDIYDLIG